MRDQIAKDLPPGTSLKDFLKSLIGLHALTGYDTVSAFAGKGKSKPFKMLMKNGKYVRAFMNIGISWNVSSELFSVMEEFVYDLYGKKIKNVNLLRCEMYCAKGGKIEPGELPPCRSSLKLHVTRANYQAGIWNRAMLMKNGKYVRAFMNIGISWNVSSELFSVMEEFVYDLYGKKIKNVNLLRCEMYCAKGGKIEPGELPPCRSSLKLHVTRANYQAGIWNRAMLMKNGKYVRAFMNIGISWNVSSELFSVMEEFVYDLYGKKIKKVNLLRCEMYCAKGGKIEPGGNDRAWRITTLSLFPKATCYKGKLSSRHLE